MKEWRAQLDEWEAEWRAEMNTETGIQVIYVDIELEILSVCTMVKVCVP